MQRLDFHLLAQQFQQWANCSFESKPGEWVPIDGKSIKGTVSEAGTAYQNFVSLVSVYSSQQGVVLATQQFESKTTSELTVVQTLLEALHLEAVVFTMDALFLSKKTRMVKLAGEKARLDVSCKQNIFFSDEPSWQGLALNPQPLAKQYWNACSQPVRAVEVQCGINTTTIAPS